MKWWGPRDYPATYLDMDVRRGGAWRCCLRSTETGKERWQGGVFRDVAPPDRLEFSFAWDEDERGLETLVTVTFAEQDGKTLMTAMLPSSRSRNAMGIREAGRAHSTGWSTTLEICDSRKRKSSARRLRMIPCETEPTANP
jgi:uncharacterized protein YndB with AHSA1/START domain